MAANPIPLPPGFELDAPAPSGAPQPIISRQAPPPTPQTPENRENTVVGTQEKRTQIANTAFDNVNNLRKQFETEQSVQDYKTVLPLMDNAFKLGPNKAGDLNLVYAFGKAMDPNSVVREGEQVMATNVGGVSEKVQGYLDSIKGQGQLTPIQRTELTEEIRHRAGSLQQTYNQRRAFYEDFAQRNGIKAEDVVGPHPGEPFVGDEKSYVTAHGGTPRDPYAPQPSGSDAPPTGRFGDKFGAPGTEVQFKDDAPNATRSQRFQQSLSDALSSKQLKNQADVNAWVGQFNQQNGSAFSIDWQNPDTRKAIDAAMKGQKFGVERPIDPEVQAKINEKLQNGNDSSSAAALVGAADPLQIGPRVGAAMSATAEAFGGKGSLSDRYNVNLDANRGYLDKLSGDHQLAYGLGQLGGSFLLPVGEARTPSALARVGAAYGAGAGVMQGDSSTSLSQRAINTTTGAAAGGAIGYAVPKGFQLGGRLLGRGAASVPELVDPATGELNQPMDAMNPAERVAQFKANGVNQVTPAMAGGRSARVIEQGFNNLPGSAGVMEDVNSAVSGEARSAMTNVADQFGTSRTLNEAGSELQRGANERIERAKPVIGKAYDAIPISDGSPTSLANTRGVLNELSSQFDSNPALAQAVKSAKIDQYAKALNAGDLSWRDLKAFRTRIGEAIGERRFNDDSATSDLRGLYGALSQDMRDTASAAGPGALRAFERANNLNRQNEEVIQGALTRILGKDGQLAPEKAAAVVQAMTKGGKSSGDIKTLAQIRSATIKSGAWDEIASTMIRLGGQPANSEGRAFNPQTFVNWYSDMAEPARRLLFKPELRKALDGFVRVSQQLARVKGMTNTSNATPTMIGSGVVAAGGVAAISHPMALLPLIGGGIANNVMARLWTSSKFVNWFTGYSRAIAKGNDAAASARVGLLPKLAATNPELREPLAALQRTLIGVNDNLVPKVAASSNSNQETQQ
jgi:hypothetical protein